MTRRAPLLRAGVRRLSNAEIGWLTDDFRM
jgi:hypothetical protein